MSQRTHIPHILNAASNLLGICFVIIGGLKLSNQNSKTFSDEFAWLAVILFLTSIVICYVAMRNGDYRPSYVKVADWSFLGGLTAVVVSVLLVAAQL
jgi:hypothetical protein